jgi:acetyl esterase/lipase
MKRNAAVPILILIVIVIAFGLFMTRSRTASTSQIARGAPIGGPGQRVNADWVRQKWLDVPYANKSAYQKLDIYLPNDGKGPFRVIVAIHGGGFLVGDKADGEMNAQLQGLKRGYAVASINYRLSDEAKFPAQICDVKAAIRFLRANVQKYNLDPGKVAAWGPSAGGNLASLAGTAGGVKKLDDLSLGNSGQSSRVQAVVDWFGPIDFLTMDAQNMKSGIADKVDNVQVHDTPDSVEARLLGAQPSKVVGLAKEASPETYITPDDPPFLIQHGTLDPLVPTQQSVDFAAALTKILGNGKVTLILMPNAGHGGPQFDSPDNISKALDFLDKSLE